MEFKKYRFITIYQNSFFFLFFFFFFVFWHGSFELSNTTMFGLKLFISHNWKEVVE